MNSIWNRSLPSESSLQRAVYKLTVKPLKPKYGIQLGKSAIVRLPLRKFHIFVIKMYKNNDNIIAYLYEIILNNVIKIYRLQQYKLSFLIYFYTNIEKQKKEKNDL